MIDCIKTTQRLQSYSEPVSARDSNRVSHTQLGNLTSQLERVSSQLRYLLRLSSSSLDEEPQ